MRISKLELEHYRSYELLAYEFSNNPVTVIVGNNGLGKTNFLESIFLLALTKSFQGKKLEEIIMWDEEWARVVGSIESCKGSKELEVFWGFGRHYPKSLKVNGSKNKAADYVGNLLVTLFSPQDLNMIHGPPQLRRRFFDVMLSQIDREYLTSLLEYRKLLRQRNKLLSNIKDGVSKAGELDFWDAQMAKHGTVLVSKRQEATDVINGYLGGDYDSIAVGQDRYPELLIMWTKQWSEHDTQSAIAEYFLSNRRRDIAVAGTCGGPHREAFSILMNNRNMAEFASRGECRTLVLSLKLGERRFIKEQTGDMPVLLLDDVLSELDTDRQKNVLELFDSEQTIITATHIEGALDSHHVHVVDVEEFALQKT
jgi:DNA replication and repair protein RecF